MARDDAISIPSALYESYAGSEDGDRWLAQLPSLVGEFLARWDIRCGDPFEGGVASWSAPATRADGTDAVLKIGLPHREADAESTALRFWDGDGAVRLFESDRAQYALLIERCRPGTKLLDAGLAADEALMVGAQLMRRLWRAPPDTAGYERMANVTAEWADGVRDTAQRHAPAVDLGLVELGAQLLDSLPGSATREVVVHGDFNPGNVLAAARQPWLAIDAKAMLGDPAFDPSHLLLQVDPPFAHANPSVVLSRRYAFVGELVGEDPSRLLAWSVARVVEYAMWEWSRGQHARALGAMDDVAVLARLAGL